MNHVHNVIVKHGMTQLNTLKDDPEYSELLKSRKTAFKSKKKEINKQLSKIIEQEGILWHQILD